MGKKRPNCTNFAPECSSGDRIQDEGRLSTGTPLFPQFTSRLFLQICRMLSRFPVILLFIAAVGCPTSGALWAQESEKPTVSGEAKANADEIETLIANLESPDFNVRNSARASLLKLDVSGFAILSEAAANAQGDLQIQLTTILDRLQSRWFETPLQDFRSNPDVVHAAKLPGWEKVRRVVGNDESALVVYREMLDAEPRLFSALQFNPSGLPAILLERSAAIEMQMKSGGDQFPAASVLALMTVGTEPGIRLVGASQSHVNSALSHPQFQRLVKNGIHASAIAAITSNWLLREHAVLDTELLFAMKLDLPAGKQLARRALEAKRTGPVECWALLTLGKLNDRESLELIERSVSSKGQFWPARGQSVQNAMPGSSFAQDYRVLASDVALAVALHLRGESLKDHGMMVASSEETLFQPHSLGFNSEEERSRSLESYRLKHAE